MWAHQEKELSDSSGDDQAPDEHAPSMNQEDEFKRQMRKVERRNNRAQEFSESKENKQVQELSETKSFKNPSEQKQMMNESNIITASKNKDARGPDLTIQSGKNMSMSSMNLSNYSGQSVRRGEDYLGSLDEFLDDNLRSIADLISIKKSMQSDIKTIAQAQDKLDLIMVDENKKTQKLENQIENEQETESNLMFQCSELQKLVVRY